jgi:hypothetical protein
MEFCGLPLIGQERPMNGAQFHPSRVGNDGGGLQRNKNAGSIKLDAMEFCGIPLIGQERLMNGAQLHPLRVGNAGGELTTDNLQLTTDNCELTTEKPTTENRNRRWVSVRQPGGR